MLGGEKGLLVNSRSLCKAPARADVKFTSQSNKFLRLRPVMQTSCKGKKPNANAPTTALATDCVPALAFSSPSSVNLAPCQLQGGARRQLGRWPILGGHA